MNKLNDNELEMVSGGTSIAYNDEPTKNNGVTCPKCGNNNSKDFKFHSGGRITCMLCGHIFDEIDGGTLTAKAGKRVMSGGGLDPNSMVC